MLISIGAYVSDIKRSWGDVLMLGVAAIKLNNSKVNLFMLFCLAWLSSCYLLSWPNCPTLFLQYALGLPLFLEAIFSASRGVLKSTGSLAGLWP
jgi:hypothetical protein